jgi:hypothetical protein
VAFQQKTGAEESHADLVFADSGAELEKVRMHERLSTREHDPFDGQFLKIFEKPGEVSKAERV